jgi:hypothetical protein
MAVTATILEHPSQVKSSNKDKCGITWQVKVCSNDKLELYTWRKKSDNIQNSGTTF